uniref:capsular polysaccharide export protein, LipB/KpsS family n=1 Tax=Dissulfurispira sp. TaxID=2817609 RepID=UPI002FD87F37
MKEFDILFSILTLPEVDFLAYMAERLIEKGNRIGFILFHEAGAEKLERMGIPFFNMHALREEVPYVPLGDNELEDFRIKFGIENLRHLFIHEKLGYNRRNEEDILNKTVHYLRILDKIFTENNVKCVVQELGGFGANQCVYYAARKNGIDHVFYEPAAFSERIVFNLNSYYSDMPARIMNAKPDNETLKEVEAYLRKYHDSKNMVVPFKDKHSFADMTLKRIFNIENARRLKIKLFHKYVHKKREEYDEIGWVVKYNFIKLARRILFGFYYRKPDYNDKYIYFPFHVPHDVQLTTRSRLFYFQEGFVEYLSRIIPYGYKLYIKEHPAAIGGHSFSVLRKILKQHDNIMLIHPKINSYDLIKHAALVISINSKVGFEAIMQGKKVVVVGDAFYKNKGITYDMANLNELGAIIANALNSDMPSKEEVMEFLTRVYLWSYPCELFLMEDKNLKQS